MYCVIRDGGTREGYPIHLHFSCGKRPTSFALVSCFNFPFCVVCVFSIFLIMDVNVLGPPSHRVVAAKRRKQLSSGLPCPCCVRVPSFFMLRVRARRSPPTQLISLADRALHCIVLLLRPPSSASIRRHDDGLRRLRHRRRYVPTIILSIYIPSRCIVSMMAWHAAAASFPAYSPPPEF